MKKRFLLIILSIMSLFSSAQINSTRLDSLLEISKTQKEVPLISTLNEISWEFKNTSIDSAFFYARKAVQLSKKVNNKKAIAYSYNSLANCYDNFGELDSALVYHQKSLDLKLQINNKEGVADSYNNLGIVYDLKGDYTKSLENYFKALNIYEEENVSFDKVPMVLNNIGIVYKKQKDYTKVLNYYKKALKIYENNGYYFGVVVTTGNIGSVFLNLKKYDSAIVYSEKAKNLYSELGYNRYIPYMLHNIATAQDSLKLHQLSQKNYIETISLFREEGNLFELTSSLLGLSKSFLTEKKYNQSLEKVSEALNISISQGFTEIKVHAYKIMALVQAGLGDYKKAYSFSEKHRLANEDLFEENKIKVVFELDKKYQTEKKEKQILSQRAYIAEKELYLSTKNTQLIGLLILSIVISLLGYLVYKQQKLKNQQIIKENELKNALAKIETQNKLQEQRIAISRDLHDSIGAQLTFIISSVENLQYKLKITNNKLAEKLSDISDFTKETINELRDTIWAMNKSEISFEDLQARISNFIDKANITSNKIEFEFNQAQQLTQELTFSSLQGMNLYRIIQESINNAVKYANSKLIKVQFSIDENQTKIIIKDDGQGFDINSVPLGNGINNMNKRAAEIAAKITIHSAVNKGTTIEVIL